MENNPCIDLLRDEDSLSVGRRCGGQYSSNDRVGEISLISLKETDIVAVDYAEYRLVCLFSSWPKFWS